MRSADQLVRRSSSLIPKPKDAKHKPAAAGAAGNGGSATAPLRRTPSVTTTATAGFTAHNSLPPPKKAAASTQQAAAATAGSISARINAQYGSSSTAPAAPKRAPSSSSSSAWLPVNDSTAVTALTASSRAIAQRAKALAVTVALNPAAALTLFPPTKAAPATPATPATPVAPATFVTPARDAAVTPKPTASSSAAIVPDGVVAARPLHRANSALSRSTSTTAAGSGWQSLGVSQRALAQLRAGTTSTPVTPATPVAPSTPATPTATTTASLFPTDHDRSAVPPAPYPSPMGWAEAEAKAAAAAASVSASASGAVGAVPGIRTGLHSTAWRDATPTDANGFTVPRAADWLQRVKPLEPSRALVAVDEALASVAPAAGRAPDTAAAVDVTPAAAPAAAPASGTPVKPLRINNEGESETDALLRLDAPPPTEPEGADADTDADGDDDGDGDADGDYGGDDSDPDGDVDVAAAEAFAAETEALAPTPAGDGSTATTGAAADRIPDSEGDDDIDAAATAHTPVPVLSAAAPTGYDDAGPPSARGARSAAAGSKRKRPSAAARQNLVSTNFVRHNLRDKKGAKKLEARKRGGGRGGGSWSRGGGRGGYGKKPRINAATGKAWLPYGEWKRAEQEKVADGLYVEFMSAGEAADNQRRVAQDTAALNPVAAAASEAAHEAAVERSAHDRLLADVQSQVTAALLGTATAPAAPTQTTAVAASAAPVPTPTPTPSAPTVVTTTSPTASPIDTPGPAVSRPAIVSQFSNQFAAHARAVRTTIASAIPAPVFAAPPAPKPIVALAPTPAPTPVPAPPVVSTAADVAAVLKDVFGFERYLSEAQRQTIERIALARESLLLVLPTGGGKSLCYQLPAYLMPGVTLVVTPLISLMHDQLMRLPKALRGGYWNSSQTNAQVYDVMQQLRCNALKVLYVSPEKLLTPGFQRFMRSLPVRVSFACIDEAHCVSEWSHNFRPAYLRLNSVLRETLGVRCILAMTATATRATEASVCASLGIDPATSLIRVSPYRANLSYAVHLSGNFASSSSGGGRETALLHLLSTASFQAMGSIIVYVMLQYQADELSKFLKAKGFHAASYHAGKTARQREAVQKAFMTNRLRIVVATIAFGMGLDKADVRSVIHFSVPRTFEHYTQEVGRAGRDGRPAECHCFFSEDDVQRMANLSKSDKVDRRVIQRFLHRLFGGVDVNANDEDDAAEAAGAGYYYGPTSAAAAARKRAQTIERSRRSAAAIDSYVFLSYQQLSEQLDMRSEMVGTLLCQLELLRPDGPYVHIVCALHNRCSIGFHRQNPQRLADAVPLIAYLMARYKGVRPVSGRFEFDVCQTATDMRVLVADVQRDIIKLKANGEISVQWKDYGVCVQIARTPAPDGRGTLKLYEAEAAADPPDARSAAERADGVSAYDLDTLIAKLETHLKHQTEVALRKLSIVSTALKLSAATNPPKINLSVAPDAAQRLAASRASAATAAANSFYGAEPSAGDDPFPPFAVKPVTAAKTPALPTPATASGSGDDDLLITMDDDDTAEPTTAAAAERPIPTLSELMDEYFHTSDEAQFLERLRDYSKRAAQHAKDARDAARASLRRANSDAAAADTATAAATTDDSSSASADADDAADRARAAEVRAAGVAIAALETSSEAKVASGAAVSAAKREVLAFIHANRNKQRYTALDVAKVFQGMWSPAFPARQWRTSEWWGKYKAIPFDQLQALVTECLQLHAQQFAS